MEFNKTYTIWIAPSEQVICTIIRLLCQIGSHIYTETDLTLTVQKPTSEAPTLRYFSDNPSLQNYLIIHLSYCQPLVQLPRPTSGQTRSWPVCWIVPGHFVWSLAFLWTCPRCRVVLQTPAMPSRTTWRSVHKHNNKHHHSSYKIRHARGTQHISMK